jgi:hypothetical protein
VEGQRQEYWQVRHVSDEQEVSCLLGHLVAAAERTDQVALGADLKGSSRMVRRDEDLEAFLVEMSWEERRA